MFKWKVEPRFLKDGTRVPEFSVFEFVGTVVQTTRQDLAPIDSEGPDVHMAPGCFVYIEAKTGKRRLVSEDVKEAFFREGDNVYRYKDSTDTVTHNGENLSFRLWEDRFTHYHVPIEGVDVGKTRRRIEDHLRKNPAAVLTAAAMFEIGIEKE